MEIQVQELEACKLSIHYEANFLEISDKRAEVENSFRKAPVKGFRNGKASLDAIRMTYRPQIEEALKRALAEDAFHNSIFEKKLRVHGAPKFNSLFMDGGRFTCDFEIYTKPNFELAPYKEMTIPKPVEPSSAEEIAQKMLQELRVKYGDVAPYTDSDFIQQGDNVIVDYEASIDGEKVNGLSAKGEMLTVGNNLLQDFDNNLLGMKSGETREFDVHAPADSLPSISGKTLHFKATLSTGAKTIPCPLNDELATRMGKTDFNTLQSEVKIGGSYANY